MEYSTTTCEFTGPRQLDGGGKPVLSFAQGTPSAGGDWLWATSTCATVSSGGGGGGGGGTTTVDVQLAASSTVDLVGNAVSGFLLYQGIFMFLMITAFILNYFRKR